MTTPAVSPGSKAREHAQYTPTVQRPQREPDLARPAVLRTTRQLSLASLFPWVDVAAVGMVILGVATVDATNVPGFAPLLSAHLPVAVLLLALCAMLGWYRAFSAAGLYDEALLSDRPREILRTLVMCVILSLLTTTAAHAVLSVGQTRGLVWLASLTTIGTSASILTLRWLLHWWVRHVVPVERNVIIVGNGPRAVRHARALEQDLRHRFAIVAWVDRRARPRITDAVSPVHHVQPLARLESLIAELTVDEVHIALPLKSCYDDFQHVITLCERNGVRVVYGADHFHHSSTELTLRDTPLGTPHVSTRVVAKAAQLPLKRCLDVAGSLVALTIFLPVLLVIAAAIRVETRGPVMFRQKRLGVGRRPFDLYKFRSMRVDAEEVLRRDAALYDEYVRNNFKLPEGRDPRITRVGRFLRKTSLDELPQLWNVLRGDMSIVGPRPIVPAEAANYGPRTPLLLHLKPGLTGAWVVKGRSQINYPERADLELQYVREWSFLTDLHICLRSVPAILLGRGAH